MLRTSSKLYQTETEHLVNEQLHLRNNLHDKDKQILSIRDQMAMSEKSLTPQQDAVSGESEEALQITGQLNPSVNWSTRSS